MAGSAATLSLFSKATWSSGRNKVASAANPEPLRPPRLCANQNPLSYARTYTEGCPPRPAPLVSPLPHGTGAEGGKAELRI